MTISVVRLAGWYNALIEEGESKRWMNMRLSPDNVSIIVAARALADARGYNLVLGRQYVRGASPIGIVCRGGKWYPVQLFPLTTRVIKVFQGRDIGETEEKAREVAMQFAALTNAQLQDLLQENGGIMINPVPAGGIAEIRFLDRKRPREEGAEAEPPPQRRRRYYNDAEDGPWG